MTLAELAIGAKCKVQRVLEADEISTRLMEMGLTPSVEIELLGTAPLGDPIEISLRGYRLSLRRTEAARVEVSVVEAVAKR